MTLQERIAIAAENCGLFKEEVFVVLAEAFPELFSDPPTGWIAPTSADSGMMNAGAIMLLTHFDPLQRKASEIYYAMADDFQARHPMKPTEAKE